MSKSLFLATALALIATSAAASTLRSYTPGGAPCNGVCTYSWAVKEFAVPEGEVQRMIVPKGSIVLKMSYSKEGKPYWQGEGMIFAKDEYAEGYSFVDESGRELVMAKLDECQNWTLVMLPPPGLTEWVDPTPPLNILVPPSPPPIFIPPTWDPPLDPPPVIECCVEPPPATVPIPASFSLMALGLGSLFLRRLL